MTDEMLDDLITHDKEYKYVGFWGRFGAAFIDGLILTVPTLSYFLLYFSANLVFVSIPLLLLAFIYKPFLEYKYGATWAKMAIDAKVVTTDDEPISLSQSVRRFLLPWGLQRLLGIISVVIVYFILDKQTDLYGQIIIPEKSLTNFNSIYATALSPLFSVLASLIMLVFGLSIAFDKEKRGLHDKIAGTMVVYKT